MSLVQLQRLLVLLEPDCIYVVFFFCQTPMQMEKTNDKQIDTTQALKYAHTQHSSKLGTYAAGLNRRCEVCALIITRHRFNTPGHRLWSPSTAYNGGCSDGRLHFSI